MIFFYNYQLQSFQLIFTERLSSKTIKVLLSNRKFTGRKRIAFDSNVHKIAIFSDELENVKQLNFSLQQFESDNIDLDSLFSVISENSFSLFAVPIFYLLILHNL
jgi:hypothetical protein